jgi:N-acetylmuramidase-like protein
VFMCWMRRPLCATSWGAFQILRDNYAQAGFGTVDLFATAMFQSIQQQLAAIVALINFSTGLTSQGTTTVPHIARTTTHQSAGGP